MSLRLVLFNDPSTCVTCLDTPNIAHFQPAFVFIEKSHKSKEDHPTNTTIFCGLIGGRLEEISL